MNRPLQHVLPRPARRLLSAACLCLGLLRAEVALSPFFAPGMVMQADAAFPVWGTADPGEFVTVTLGGHVRNSAADREGRWRVAFPHLPRGGEALRLGVKAENQLDLHPVWIGDLFVVAGDIPRVSGDTPPSESPPEVSALFTVPPMDALLPSTRLEGDWASASAHPLADALAAELADRSGMPVGLILLSAPGLIDAWIPADALAALPAAAPLLEVYEKRGLSTAVEASRDDYRKRLEAWRRAGQNLPLEPEDRPRPGETPEAWRQAPSSRVNAMAAPLAGLPMRGLFWVHGRDEQSAGRAAQYGELLPAALEGFRRLFRRETLPIQILQTGSQRFRRLDDRDAAELREAQWHLQTDPNNRVVVSLDLGPDPDGKILADRMADAMLSQLRGDREGISPSPASIQTRDDALVVSFRDTGGGLRSTGQPLQGFVLRDGDRRWVWADAVIDGDDVRVSAPGVAHPAAVRYAWRDLPARGATLVNARGLPAPSFRSDEEPLVTRNAVKPGDLRRHSLIGELYVEDPRLPRVLIIGDSVAIGQIPTLRRLFDGRANILVGNHLRGAGFYTTPGALKDDTLARFLEETGPYDVVQFNMGIHEFAGRREPKKTAPGYGERLRNIVGVLRAHSPDTRLVWCSSTGSQADGLIDRFPLYLTAARAYNAEAKRVMRELQVPVTDLFGHTQPEAERYIAGDHIHLRLDVKPEISQFMAENLREALEN